MTPPVKPRTTVCRRCGIIPLVPLLAAAAVMAAGPRDSKVVLWKNIPLPSGTVLREIREIRAENGKRTTKEGGNVTVNGMRYVHRVNLVRRLVGSNRIQVSVRESARECVFYLGAAAPPSNETATPLQALDLRMRLVSGRWLYELDKGTPTDAQRFALAELGQYADLLGVLALCNSTQPRAKGETWKVDPLPKPPGKAYGYVVPEALECRLEDVTDGEGGPLARIAVNGKLKLERPLNLNGSVSVTFAGTIMHRLSDMIDVDTSLKGTFSYSGPVLADGKPATSTIDLAWALTRTQKIEPK